MNEQNISDAVLVGVAKKGSDSGECERSLDELASSTRQAAEPLQR